MSKYNKEQDPCYGCFGASFGDCHKCNKHEVIQRQITDSSGSTQWMDNFMKRFTERV